MKEERKANAATPADRSRRTWSKPTMNRFEASAAEVATRTTGDGPFSTS